MNGCGPVSVIFLCVLLSGCLMSRPQQSLIHEGDTLPVTHFETVDGQNIHFDAKTKKLLILFNTWCPHSKKALKDLARSSLVRRKDLVIVAVAPGEGGEAIQDFRRTQPIPIHFVADFYRNIYGQLATSGVPRFYLVDKSNRVVKEFFGWHDGAVSKLDWAP